MQPVEIKPTTAGSAINRLHHRHDSGIACAACEITRLRAELKTEGETMEDAHDDLEAARKLLAHCADQLSPGWFQDLIRMVAREQRRPSEALKALQEMVAP